jgi:hypothetical protein
MAKPVYQIRKGVLQLAAWETNGAEGQKGYSFKLNRRYKDKRTGEWTDSPFLFDSDLLTAAALLQQAFADLCITRPAMASGSGAASSGRVSSAAAPPELGPAAAAQYVTRDAQGNPKLVDENGDDIPF